MHLQLQTGVIRCDELQGYYFSRPLPALEFTQFQRSVKPGSQGA
jgi:EAL domain-containing protein (putative c-di-GMP-specific phosphodiesterase class I)